MSPCQFGSGFFLGGLIQVGISSGGTKNNLKIRDSAAPALVPAYPGRVVLRTVRCFLEIVKARRFSTGFF